MKNHFPKKVRFSEVNTCPQCEKIFNTKIIIFKNMCEFFREKSQIVVLSTFDQREFKKINYFDENVYSVRERVKNALSRTLYTFSSK